MNGIATAPEFQSTSQGGFTFQNTGTDTGMFLNSNNEPEFRINNKPKAVVRNNPSLQSSDNTIVTMAMLQEFKAYMFSIQFPVGISIITQDPRNPAEYLGFGSWERDLEGRALVGYSSDVSANTPDWKKQVNNIYGSDTHTLTVDQIPAHKHQARQCGDANNVVGIYDGATISGTSNSSAASKLAADNSILETGGGQPHNNVQMSKVKMIWTRVA